MTRRIEPISDAHAIALIARRIARQECKRRLQGQRISLKPINLTVMANQLLAEQGTRIYAEARAEWTRVKPSIVGPNPRRTRKARKGDVEAQSAVEAKPV
jgi:hypothetical protein